MSNMINALDSTGKSLQFNEFVKAAENAASRSKVVRFLGDADSATVHEVTVTSTDKIGKLGRGSNIRNANDTTRAIFRQSIAAMFGGESKIPQPVLAAIKTADYGQGKPLSAKRIMLVKAAVDQALTMFPIQPPKVIAPKAGVPPKNAGVMVMLRPAGNAEPGKILSANDVAMKGYAKGELKKLNDVATLYQKATNCSKADAQKAALDAKSPARRLFSYGGLFTSSPENFAKGLDLIDKFSEWFFEYCASDENQNALKPLDFNDNQRLSVEKFLLEEIACNPKFKLDTPNKADLFSPRSNPAMQFIADNMMQSVSGSMFGISPEKRSVVYAVANALRQPPSAGNPNGTPFGLNHALVSRTLANFSKIADIVYSGKLNRTTAFNTLFSDLKLKPLGVTDKSSNEMIADKFNNYVLFNDERTRAMENDDEALVRQLKTKGDQAIAMANSSGATVQECRKAVQDGRTLPSAPGMTDITSDFGDSSGLFSDPGRRQFIADIHRPQMPTDKSGNPVIDEKDNVFRFRIGGTNGQTFRAEVCDDAESSRQNAGIANAIGKFCGAKVHPAQANTVFFALAQGGLSKQMSSELSNRGYVGSDHGPLVCTLTKDANTGDVTIKYENPDSSPVKFSWTTTVDVDGKVTTTPIKIKS